jgi:hypothetical protein
MASNYAAAMIALLCGALVIFLPLFFRKSNMGQAIVIRIGLLSVTFFSLFIIYFLVDQILSMFWDKTLPYTKDIATAFVIYFGFYLFSFSFYPKLVTKLLERWDFRLAALGIAMVVLGIGFLV